MRAALNEGLGFSSAAAAEQGRRPRGGAAAAVALVVGSDIPDLRPSDVRAAVDALSEGSPMTMETAKVSGGDKPRPDCVLGPAADGGFWVVGMRRSWSGGGGSETSGSGNASPSLLLLPDTLLEVRFLYFFLFLLLFLPLLLVGGGGNPIPLTHK